MLLGYPAELGMGVVLGFLLLMAEILHHLGCMKPYYLWTGAGFQPSTVRPLEYARFWVGESRKPSKQNFFPGGGSCAVAAISLASGSQGTCEFSLCFFLDGWRFEKAEMIIHHWNYLGEGFTHEYSLLGAWYCIPLKTKCVKNLILIYLAILLVTFLGWWKRDPKSLANRDLQIGDWITWWLLLSSWRQLLTSWRCGFFKTRPRFGWEKRSWVSSFCRLMTWQKRGLHQITYLSWLFWQCITSLM